MIHPTRKHHLFLLSLLKQPSRNSYSSTPHSFSHTHTTFRRFRHTMPSSLKQCQDKATSNGHQDEDIKGPSNEWKFNSPYRVHEPTDNFKPLYEASCHCGRIQYQLSRERPLASKLCHCSTCQTLHGAMFQWAAIFEKEDINFVRGHHDLVWYDPGEKTTRHKLPCKVSCGYCRSLIMDEGRNMILLFPSLIKFKSEQEKKNFEPE